MNENEDSFIARMKTLAQAGEYAWVERLPEGNIVQAEARLGFPLPSLLRRIYIEVGDGAFGLFPLNKEDFNGLCDMDLVESYLELRSSNWEECDACESGSQDRPLIWPEKLLIIYDWGCNIYSCLDCSKLACPVLRNDNNISVSTYSVEAPSFQLWLQALLDGTLDFDWETAEKVTF